jgi:hypothetical protein
LACDVASARQLRSRIAAFQRAGWQVAAMKICLVHDVPPGRTRQRSIAPATPLTATRPMGLPKS